MTSAPDRSKRKKPAKQHKSGAGQRFADSGISPWRNIPRSSIFAFLGAVFFVFTSVGFASDIGGMGREPIPRFVIGVVTSGVFAIFYATSGIALRRKFWMALPPIFALQFCVSWLVGSAYPDKPQASPMSAVDMNALKHRLSLDATLIVFAVSLGYTGFAYVAVSEGRRYARARMEMAVLEGEMVAAGEIQKLMLPEQGESFPGFAVESVYKPAREVGGDFFQILPAGDGLLLVFGDVAGKGLPAAMLVSMIVGSIRAIADDTRDPAEMLRKLHDRLLGRTSGGFSTAIAAHITGEGAVTIANAGHPSPYLDGREIDLPGALPLGLASAGHYETTTFRLEPGSRLTFVSDGVVEAQTQSGELFGFERVRAISSEPAAAIAQAAVDFGQSDDITVVTIARPWPAEMRVPA